jgi:hypothetical protein
MNYVNGFPIDYANGYAPAMTLAMILAIYILYSMSNIFNKNCCRRFERSHQPIKFRTVSLVITITVVCPLSWPAGG